jgi:hypothetical protein
MSGSKKRKAASRWELRIVQAIEIAQGVVEAGSGIEPLYTDLQSVA